MWNKEVFWNISQTIKLDEDEVQMEVIFDSAFTDADKRILFWSNKDLMTGLKWRKFLGNKKPI